MVTTITKRGQTAVPAEIRKRLGLGAHTKLEWFVDNTLIRVIPVPRDPIKAMRGMFKGSGLTNALLKERKRERQRERIEDRKRQKLSI